MLNFVFVAAMVAMLLSTASFAVKNEGIRGAGRMIGGVGIALFGVVFISLWFADPTLMVYFAWNGAALAWGGLALILFGGFTVYVGLRKFKRRNLVAEVTVEVNAPGAAAPAATATAKAVDAVAPADTARDGATRG